MYIYINKKTNNMKKLSTIVFMILGIFAYSQTINGTATYYSGKHHGRKTASGTIYNQNELTCAASSKFKFGTVLKVTNVSNGKAVIVKVTDRGGAIKGNKLDLSQAAFKNIASLKKGFIKILIEEIEG